MTTPPSADGVCATSRLLPFTAAQIYAAFADANLLAIWWGPDGFTNTFERCEFRPQGRWTFVMHGPDGKNYPNDSVFLEASPQRIVVRHLSAPNFTLTITLTETDGQTHVLWHQAFDDPRVAASVAHIIAPANEQNLNRLHAALLAARP
ncbi:SRPBCC domain-containing protein [Rhodoferax fermentans]|uniref:Polyketide cyclase n=1 Tax=Rhodoferax fermentans TaxID=28066 RepID=A0A1T1AQX9_RHOFE|nr:SRPBCC domain-containing protein [Rhodoferax fermentans]MBK1683655.1 polyketide cyclase [Rhodoferax fermentans]OOV06385.1 polyketide cyclase [Rhodoferax fermentans]